MAAALQLLLSGMPFIYYGDEYGMTGGDDPDCRRGMLWDEKRQDADMFAYYKKLIQIRKEYPVITEGKVTSCVCEDKKGSIMLIRELGAERAAIVFNIKEFTVEVEISKNEMTVCEKMLLHK